MSVQLGVGQRLILKENGLPPDALKDELKNDAK